MVETGLAQDVTAYQSSRELAGTFGGVIFYGVLYKAVTYYGHKVNAEGKQYLGLTLPLWLGAVGMGVGLVVMLISRPFFREFFSRKTETAPPGLLEQPVEHAPAHF